MNKAADHPTTKSNAAPDVPAFTAGAIGMQFLSTTWRIAVPSVLGTVLGLIADRRWHTKPWLTFLGVAVGFGLAGLLIKRELDSLKDA